MRTRLDNRYISGSMAIATTSCMGKRRNLLWWNRFNGDGHTFVDVTIIVIDKKHSYDSCLCKIWESRWIRTLETSYPSGPNLRVDSL